MLEFHGIVSSQRKFGITMRKTLLLFGLMLTMVCAFAQEKIYPGNYELAARFSPEKLKKMIFSTSVDPHWMKK